MVLVRNGRVGAGLEGTPPSANVSENLEGKSGERLSESQIMETDCLAVRGQIYLHRVCALDNTKWG